MKIIYFGTPEFALFPLEALAKHEDFEILAVVTQEDKKVGRKGTLTPPPVKKLAQELNITVIQAKNQKELKEKLQPFKADFFVVVAFGMILKNEILKIPKYGSINIHASLLPNYRGASPIHESLLNGDKETGVTFIKMDEKLDHGNIYLMQRIPIDDNDNYLTLSTKIALTSASLLPSVLIDIKEKFLTPIPQQHEKATFCKKIKKQDGEINWEKTAKEIKNMTRAFKVWPNAYTKLKNKTIKILETEIRNETCDKNPGTFYIEDKTLKIATIDGILIPKILQMEGKKEMLNKEFINGYKKLIE